MKVPKTWGGVTVIRKPAITGVGKDKNWKPYAKVTTVNGKPVIEVYRPNKVGKHQLNHELGHIKLKHSEKKVDTVGDSVKHEVQAERFALKKSGGAGKISSKELTAILNREFSRLLTDKQVNNIYFKQGWNNFLNGLIVSHSSYGLTKEEMLRAVRYWDKHKKK